MLAISAGVHASQHKHEIVFTCPAPPHSILFRIMAASYRHFFAQNELGFRMIHGQERRGVLEVSQGRFDGVCGKTGFTLDPQTRKSLLQTNASLLQLSITPLGRSGLPEISDLAAPQNAQYRFGVIEGSSSAYLARKYNLNHQDVSTVDRGVRMLAANRLDYLLSNVMQMRRVIGDIKPEQQLQFSSAVITVPAPPLLNERHDSLLAPFDQYIHTLSHCMGGPMSHSTLHQWESIAVNEVQSVTASRTHPCIAQALTSLRY